MIVDPEMIGGVVVVSNFRVFTQVEVKLEAVGHYNGQFSIV